MKNELQKGKASHFSDVVENLGLLYEIRDLATDSREKTAITQLIYNEFKRVGIDVNSIQIEEVANA